MARNATFSAQPDVAALLIQATAATASAGGPMTWPTTASRPARCATASAPTGEVRGLMVTPAGTAQSRPG